MRRFYWWVFLVVLVVLGGFGLWWYKSSSISVFGEKMREFEQFDISPVDKAEIELLFDGDEDGQYAGALLKVSEDKVWVEGGDGIKRYELYDGSILFFYSLCDAFEGKKEGEKVDPDRYIYQMDKFEVWRDKAKEGYHVTVVKNTLDDNKEDLGKAKEVRVYNWWSITPGDWRHACEE